MLGVCVTYSVNVHVCMEAVNSVLQVEQRVVCSGLL